MLRSLAPGALAGLLALPTATQRPAPPAVPSPSNRSSAATVPTPAVPGALVGPAPGATAGPAPGFMAAFGQTRGFSLGRPTGIRPTPDGREILFLRSPPREATLALFSTDVATGATRELLTAATLLGGAEEVLTVDEKARRERMRVTDRGLTSFDLSQDGRLLVLPLSGRLYLYQRATGKVRAFGDGKAALAEPRLAPDGKTLSFVRGHDVWALDLGTGKERRLTGGGTADVTHGVAEFVAQEEMARFEGNWWSPDGKALAFEESDNRPLETFSIADPAHPERAPNAFRYPRAGKANAIVRLGLVPADGSAAARMAAAAEAAARTTGVSGKAAAKSVAAGKGGPVWVEWDRERYPYLARVVWREKAAPLTILVQTRDQREEAVLAVDPATGKTRPLLVEKDDDWVELHGATLRWLPNGKGFLWSTERDGAPALELRRADGTLDRVLVPPGAGFLGVLQVDPESQFLHVLTGRPTATYVSRLALAGGPPAVLTPDDAERSASFSRDGSVFVEARTGVHELPRFVVHADGVDKGELPQVAEAPPFRVNLELTTVRGASGRIYHVALVRPRAGVGRRKLPVIVNVYGGPTSLTVRADERGYLLQQWIADHGAVVVSIDNRGTPRRDRQWSRAIKGRFGEVPLEDQAEAVQALARRFRELDGNRVGIYGWSFGGYMSALAVLRRPDVFKAGVAGAPVVDWEDYDTHYTERYLDLPARAPEAYRSSSLLGMATGLQRPLLLVHGTADDNVYFFHSLKLSAALFKAGRPHEVLPLAGTTHQVADPVMREKLWERVATWLLERLGSGS